MTYLQASRQAKKNKVPKLFLAKASGMSRSTFRRRELSGEKADYGVKRALVILKRLKNEGKTNREIKTYWRELVDVPSMEMGASHGEK